MRVHLPHVVAFLLTVVGNVSGLPAFHEPVPFKIPNTNILLEITLDWPQLYIPASVFSRIINDAIAAVHARARHFGGMNMQMPNDFLDTYEGFELTVERNEQQTGYVKDLPTFNDANNIIVGIHEIGPRLMMRTFRFECWRVDQQDRKVRKFAMGVLKELHWARVQSPTTSLASLTMPTSVVTA